MRHRRSPPRRHGTRRNHISVILSCLAALAVVQHTQTTRHLFLAEETARDAPVGTRRPASHAAPWVPSPDHGSFRTEAPFDFNNATLPSDDTSAAPRRVTGVARFPNGTLGYIADPTMLRRGILDRIKRFQSHPVNDTVSTLLLGHYWSTVDVYASEFSYAQAVTTHPNDTVPYSDIVISADTVCSIAPGLGMEGGIGPYQLLTQTIHVHDASRDDRPSHSNQSPIRVLCALYTHAPRQYTLVRTAAVTWGASCDGFLAFANVTVPALGLVEVVHPGPESYGNLWQKTRSIWRYLFLHYLEDYDYFHLSGDDVYVIVANLRHFLQTRHERLQREQATLEPELYAGQWVRQKRRPYIGGGPGYTLSRATLRRFMDSGVWETCQADTAVSYEDRLLSQCLSKLLTSIDFWVDTRDVATGAQQYLGSPRQVYEGRSTKGARRLPSFYSRLMAYWETLPYPRHPNHTSVQNESIVPTNRPVWMPVPPGHTAVGPRQGLDAAGTHSVAFHQIRHPLFQARMHALLHPHLCSAATALGRRQHVGSVSDV